MFKRTRGQTSQHPSRSSRRLAWALALALLLPFAQALAWVHVLSHHSTLAQRTDSGASTGSFDTPCATCLAATPLHAGALPVAQSVVAVAPLHHAQPSSPQPATRAPELALAYRSRAPPHLS